VSFRQPIATAQDHNLAEAVFGRFAEATGRLAAFGGDNLDCSMDRPRENTETGKPSRFRVVSLYDKLDEYTDETLRHTQKRNTKSALPS
jgi:hypothetical protein